MGARTDDVRLAGSGSRSLWMRAGALTVLLAAGVAGAVLGAPSIDAVRAWRESAGPATSVVMVLGVSLALLIPVPRSALSVLVGAAVGFTTGLMVVVLAAVLGGLGGYAISRWLGRAAISRVAGRRLRQIDRALERRGVVAVAGARVLPVVPFMVVSYAAGLTGVRMAPYLVGTAAGVIPGSLVYVAVGASLALPTLATASWLWAAAGIAVVATAYCAAVIRRRRDYG